jgi:hypothetical protein
VGEELGCNVSGVLEFVAVIATGRITGSQASNKSAINLIAKVVLPIFRISTSLQASAFKLLTLISLGLVLRRRRVLRVVTRRADRLQDDRVNKRKYGRQQEKYDEKNDQFKPQVVDPAYEISNTTQKGRPKTPIGKLDAAQYLTRDQSRSQQERAKNGHQRIGYRRDSDNEDTADSTPDGIWRRLGY